MTRLATSCLIGAILLGACSSPDGEGDVRAGSPSPSATAADAAPDPAPPTAPSEQPTATTTPQPTAVPSPDPADLHVTLEVAGDGFDGPVHTFAHDGHTFVVEQVGRVTDLDSGEVWLDLTDRVRSGGEQGLLGVDVHPEQGFWVAHWTAGDGATTLATYRTGDGARPDPATEAVVLRVAQPARNHNGGTATYGPDGMLWLALGDGGGAGDRYGNGQDPGTLLGALLRLDLDDPTTARVPDDNPFASGGGAGEVWAYGLRNPYRVAFSDEQVYIADVGQNAVEEITVLTYDQAGANLGWPAVEGDRCYQAGCDLEAYEPADVAYTHDSVGGCSVIGGMVYAGEALPALGGHFLYGDLCGGILRTVRAEGGDVVDEYDLTEQIGSVEGVTGIGNGADGEPLLTIRDGRVLRLVPA